MAFEIFTETKHTIKKRMEIKIHSRYIVYFSPAARRELGWYLIVGYDAERRVLGFQPTNEDDPFRHTLYHNQNVRLQAPFDYFGIDTEGSFALRKEGDWYCADLTRPISRKQTNIKGDTGNGSSK